MNNLSRAFGECDSLTSVSLSGQALTKGILGNGRRKDKAGRRERMNRVSQTNFVAGEQTLIVGVANDRTVMAS